MKRLGKFPAYGLLNGIIRFTKSITLVSHGRCGVSDRWQLYWLFSSFSRKSSKKTKCPYYRPFVRGIHQSLVFPLKPRSHCADHSLPMFPIIADRPDLSWSWQNHQIVALAPDLCLSKTASSILVQQLYDIGTTEVFDPLLVRFPQPLVRPLIRSTRLRARCWRPHPRSCRFATTIKTT